MSKSNVKKAEELATESRFLSDFPHDKASVYYGALKMAAWKDSEFEKEKARWIENAWNWLTSQKGERTIDDFKNAMKNG